MNNPIATRWRACVSALVSAALTQLLCASASAAPNDEDRIAAQALFEQARDLIKSGNTQDACPKFAESQRLDPGIGTQFNLADCYERVGKLASAYTAFMDVAARARGVGQVQREQVARQRAEAVKPKLTKLILVVPEAAKANGLEVARDEVGVGEAQWGLPIPIDPGTHKIRVSAPGKQTWEGSVAIPADAQEHTFSIAPLLEAPTSSSDKRTRSTPSDQGVGTGSSWPLQKKLGLGAAGVGVIGLGVGGYFGLQALSKKNEASEYCDGNECTQPGYDARKGARSAGNMATIGGAVGLVGLAAGAVLFFTAKNPKQAAEGVKALHIVPTLARNEAGWVVAGSF